MAHQTNPKSLRMKGIDDWSSKGFYGRKFSRLLEQDFFIREFLEKKLNEAGVESIVIERFPGRLNVIVKSARPGLIIGRGGSGAEDLKKELKQALATMIKRRRKEGKIPEIRMEIQELRDSGSSAKLIGQSIAKQIEKRIPFRRVLKQTLEGIAENKQIKGARVEVAGRLDGAEIARREWLKRGRLPRQTLRADIDYAEVCAHCTYGAIGIKVWLYKGEKFD